MKQRDFAPDARLGACAAFVRKGSRVADIGTDHALLPIRLVETGVSPGAIAADINEGPISRARANIAVHGLENRISAVVCDGLAGIEPDSVDDIVIAGMGGELIAAILSRSPWVEDGRLLLVLQPMTRSEMLRGYLYERGFDIVGERAVDEGEHVYTVICAHYSAKAHMGTLCELYAGALLGSADPAARRYCQRQAKLLRSRAEGLRHAGDAEKAQEYEQAANTLGAGGD